MKKGVFDMSMPITEDRILEAMEASMMGDDMVGFCDECGADADNVEPDAMKYLCEVCGEHAVYGIENYID
jgi:Zn finger protein HypA/HybF involved in hydrogenase expression